MPSEVKGLINGSSTKIVQMKHKPYQKKLFQGMKILLVHVQRGKLCV